MDRVDAPIIEPHLTREERDVFAQVSRRTFMGATAGATLAALVGREPQRLDAAQAAKLTATADAVIVLWMAGGMAQTETFDPKRYTPFEPGVPIEKVLSTFPSIPTTVDGIQFTKGLEQIASVIDRGTVIRTFNAADLGFILHSRHQYHWHTGYIPPQPMAMPHLGAVISKTLGPKNPDVPAFVAIGQTVEGAGEIGTLKAFHTAGFLGDRARSVPDHRPQGRGLRGATAEGAWRRRASAAGGRCSRSCWRRNRCISMVGDFQRESLIRSLDGADRLLRSPSAKAFDLSLEPKKSFDAYNTGPFRPGLPAGPSPGRGRRALRRGHLRVHSVRLLGHARARARARRGHEEADRRADRAADSRSRRARACSTAPW